MIPLNIHKLTLFAGAATLSSVSIIKSKLPVRRAKRTKTN